MTDWSWVISRVLTCCLNEFIITRNIWTVTSCPGCTKNLSHWSERRLSLRGSNLHPSLTERLLTSRFQPLPTHPFHFCILQPINWYSAGYSKFTLLWVGPRQGQCYQGNSSWIWFKERMGIRIFSWEFKGIQIRPPSLFCQTSTLKTCFDFLGTYKMRLGWIQEAPLFQGWKITWHGYCHLPLLYTRQTSLINHNILSHWARRQALYPSHHKATCCGSNLGHMLKTICHSCWALRLLADLLAFSFPL